MANESAGTIDPLLKSVRFEEWSIDRKTIGAKITEETLSYLREMESKRPSSVHTVILHFRNNFTSDYLDYLVHSAHHPEHREERYALALTNAHSAQETVKHYLHEDGSVAAHFKNAPDFIFEPPRHVRSCPLTNTLIVPATSRLVSKLWTFPNVVAIKQDFAVEPVPCEIAPLSSTIEPLAFISPEWAHRNGHTWGWNVLDLDGLHRDGLRGHGITLGIIDTGVCEDHRDLVFKVKDFAKVESPTRLVPAHSFDSDGHGTHCAGVMVGAHNSGVQIGGAPAAALKAVSALETGYGSGRNTWSKILLALDWLADIYRGARVINLSFGKDMDGVSDMDKRLLESTFSNLMQNRDVVCVAAIGNVAGRSSCPGRLHNVLGVGALSSSTQVWDQSGSNPDFVLPGVSIYSCAPNHIDEFQGASYARLTGTSCASPHLSALVGLLMESCPSANPLQIIQALKATARGVGIPDELRGYGIPDVRRALDWIGRRQCNGTVG